VKDRIDIVRKITSEEPYQAKESAEFMIENLCRYDALRKRDGVNKRNELSEIGYKIIRDNWKTIKDNSSGLSDEKIGAAYNYLIQEHRRLNTKSATSPKIKSEPVKEKPSRFSRLTSWFRH